MNEGDEEVYVYAGELPWNEHTAEQPICPIDPTCPCREDPDNIAILNNAVTGGLLTPGEATDIIKAKHV